MSELLEVQITGLWASAQVLIVAALIGAALWLLSKIERGGK